MQRFLELFSRIFFENIKGIEMDQKTAEQMSAYN